MRWPAGTCTTQGQRREPSPVRWVTDPARYPDDWVSGISEVHMSDEGGWPFTGIPDTANKNKINLSVLSLPTQRLALVNWYTWHLYNENNSLLRGNNRLLRLFSHDAFSNECNNIWRRKMKQRNYCPILTNSRLLNFLGMKKRFVHTYVHWN